MIVRLLGGPKHGERIEITDTLFDRREPLMVPHAPKLSVRDLEKPPSPHIEYSITEYRAFPFSAFGHDFTFYVDRELYAPDAVAKWMRDVL